ncbi:unnamed protein product [Cuscuta europaea]|uniref:Shugoshin C-terminal domain-containing protein n=1 Tax=Cuscuta europaea TaxID=41803 RepID=A0A9P1A2K2_CUSEU|nr:unnamed protein product [Cuscuta europaea]
MVKKSSSFGSIVRKRLSDITTSLPQLKPHIDFQKENRSTKDFVDHLVKENIALARLIQERNKVIEMSGIELNALRAGFQKVQLQNSNLAQSNTHMLAELHFNKEKVKALQHELVCKEAMLKARFDVKNKEAEVGGCTPNADAKPNKSNRKLQATRSRSMVYSTTSQQASEKTAADSKRHCLRRQQREAAKKAFECEDTASKCDKMVEDGHTPSGNKSSCLKRATLGRPLRRAAGKVQVPLNIKMRTLD